MNYILSLVKISPSFPGSGALYRLSRNSVSLRGLRLWCHTTAVVSGSSVELFVYNMRPCHQAVTLSVEDFGELLSYN